MRLGNSPCWIVSWLPSVRSYGLMSISELRMCSMSIRFMTGLSS